MRKVSRTAPATNLRPLQVSILDHDVDAAVLATALRGVVGGDWAVLAERLRRHRGGVNALRLQMSDHICGAGGGKFPIGREAPLQSAFHRQVIGEPLNHDLLAFEVLQRGRNLVEHLNALPADLPSALWKEDLVDQRDLQPVLELLDLDMIVLPFMLSALV